MDITNYAHAINDEPNEDWTIEELLQWCLLQSKRKTMAKRDELINALETQFKNGENEILQLQQQAVKAQRRESAMKSKSQDPNAQLRYEQQNEKEKTTDDANVRVDENQNPNLEEAISYNASGQNMKSKKTSKPTSIHIEITQGKHAGSTYDLKPSHKRPCWVGRSKGKKFSDRGISLHRDDEVSTTHGKFHVDSPGPNGKFIFTDTGSTNGTIYNGAEIEDNVPLELVDGMVLVVGSCYLLIHLR